MKRVKKQKLSLRSETVATLDREDLALVVGGSGLVCVGPVLCSKMYSGCRSGGTSDCNVSQNCVSQVCNTGVCQSNAIC